MKIEKQNRLLNLILFLLFFLIMSVLLAACSPRHIHSSDLTFPPTLDSTAAPEPGRTMPADSVIYWRKKAGDL